jgi:Mce-associated membrane protein
MRTLRKLPLLLVVVAVAVVGLGTWFMIESKDTRSAGEGGNAALVDTGATTEVSGQITQALERIFSYSYDNVAATEQAAREVLAGAAVEDYNTLIGQVRAKAPEQKLVLSTTVSVTGVRALDRNSAQLLVFLDQAATRVDTAKSSGSAAVLSVSARRIDGAWRITKLTPR